MEAGALSKNSPPPAWRRRLVSVILVGIFSFGDHAETLLTALPPMLVVRGGTDCNTSWLKMTLNAIAEELAEEQPGSNLVIAKLADLLFIKSLRAYLATDLHSIGWMRGIMDLLWRAISRMHAAPERRWTLQALAEEAGCSRAVFAQRFSALGQGALSYLRGSCTSPPVCCSMEPATLEPWPAEWATDQKQPSQSHSSAGPGSHPRISPYDASCW